MRIEAIEGFVQGAVENALVKIAEDLVSERIKGACSGFSSTRLYPTVSITTSTSVLPFFADDEVCVFSHPCRVNVVVSSMRDAIPEITLACTVFREYRLEIVIECLRGTYAFGELDYLRSVCNNPRKEQL